MNQIPNEPEREAEEHVAADEMVDDQSDQSFPASDPPSWTLGPH